nr:hypothetical protein [Ralstonia sp.]
MLPGDRILYVDPRGAEPRPGVVAGRYGTSCWVRLVLDDGAKVEQAFAAANHFQSPRGNYCVPAAVGPIGART